MSVFGGDSWAREAQHRKRRVDDLMLSSSSSSSWQKLSSGKYACVVCPHNPILDSPLMLSMHLKGSRHTAAESRLNERELRRQEELNKRIALSADSATSVSSSRSSVPHLKHSRVTNKPLIEWTQKAILEIQGNKLHGRDAVDGCRNMKARMNISVSKTKISRASSPATEPSQDAGNSDENIAGTKADGKLLADWHEELRRRREKEIKFTAAGWKRDCHGKWYKDENGFKYIFTGGRVKPVMEFMAVGVTQLIDPRFVGLLSVQVEFDSDEEDPNVCLA